MIEILSLLFNILLSITNNYGITIVIYCIALNLLLTPVYFFFEILTEKIKDLKEKIFPQIEKLKGVSNLKERHFYKIEIYKKYGYNQFYDFSHLFNFFIQIPFLIGTYFLFQKNTGFIGEGFFFVNDLSRSDELINFFSFRLNFLPFLMTFLSSIAALFIYSQNKKEFNQTLIINLIFLILLYGQPSSLLIFWITNLCFTPVFKAFTRIINLKNWNFTFFFKIISSIYSKNKALFIKSKPYIIAFAVALLPYLYLFELNFFYIKDSSHIILIIFLLLFSVSCLYVLEKIFYNYNKSLLVFYVILIIFFSYDFFEGLVSIRHRYLILIDFLAIVLLVILFKALLPPSKTFMRILNTVLSIYSVFLIFKIVGLSASASDKSSFSQISKQLNTPSKKNPDIYFIVLDGYANHSVLREKFSFNNSDYLNSLLEKGFFIDSLSRANYLLTDLSLYSTLNVRYLNDKIINKISGERGLLSSDIQNSFVSNYLKNKNYTIINLDGSRGPLSPNLFSDYNLSYKKPGLSGALGDFVKSVLLKTILKPVILNFFNNYNEYYSVLYQLENLNNLDKIDGSKFVISHIVSPHPPYVFNQDGTKKASEFNQNDWVEKDIRAYLDQIRFLNTKTQSIIEDILKKNKNSIIIIQSDHGSSFSDSNSKNWTVENLNLIKERVGVINHVYLPENSYKDYYQGSSLVNTFILLFNAVFDEEFRVLKDSTFFSNYSDPFNFYDITKISDSLISNTYKGIKKEGVFE